ncbi:MAG TPA: HEAT repeat domain-containing protein [Polyangiales bacterium]|nr:HEAT repeat domain-containing protein [Polyangiales bacterium]
MRTALAGGLLFLVPAPLGASDIAPYTQLQDAPEGELIGLLDRVANARTSSETRAAAAVAVAKLLERGHTDAVTDRALETLGALGAPQGGRMLAQYTHHRRPATRARAYAALGKVAGADPALRQRVANGLRDDWPGVRGAAARALEVLKAREATATLLQAVGRGVPEAAVTLGTIGEPSSLEGFTAYLGKQPLDVMLSGYDRWLSRPDLDEKAKLGIIARLEDVAGPEVLRFVSALGRRRELSPAVRQSAAAATLRIGKAQATQAKP